MDDDRRGAGVLDVLPQPVRRQILDTVHHPSFDDEFLLQYAKKGRPWKQEAGVLRATDRVMIAVHAKRQIEVPRRWSERRAEAVLAATPWHVQALTARLGPEEVLVLSTQGAATLAVEGDRRVALPPASGDPRRLG
ncbi:hypothetical protein [Jiangella asiatica]|uniref:Uncharacterized protein n=1 Tax=Jiangella asiatica TaxID=2530372 RepID=A0A4R5DPA6_9ACTN|nr:hypothetical protein [Jiangella asiatica]TDE12583.1 hypothetical protein E1269_07000 [Jiangella asiatica]